MADTPPQVKPILKITAEGSSLGAISASGFASDAMLNEIYKAITGVKASIEGQGKGKDKKKEPKDTVSPIMKKIQETVGISAESAKKADQLVGLSLKSLGGGAIEDLLGLVELGPEVLLLVVAFKALGFALKAVQAVLNAATRTITAVASSWANVANTFLQGKKRVSDFYEAIAKGTESIPIFGTFAGIVANFFKVLDGWSDKLQELTLVGASFNGSVLALATGAAQAGMSVDEYSKIINNNAAAFAKFGSVMDGVNLYTRLANKTMRENSEELLSYGISLAQYNEFLPKAMSLFGAIMKARGASENEINRASLDLIENFTALSKLTGKSVEQQAKELEEISESTNWQQYLRSLPKEASEHVQQMLGSINAVAGKDIARIAQAAFQGLPAPKDLADKLGSLGGLSDTFEKMRQLSLSGLSGAELQKQQSLLLADLLQTGVESAERNNTIITAGAYGYSEYGKQQGDLLQSIITTTTNYRDANNRFDRAAFLKQQEKDRQQQDFNNQFAGFINQMSELQSAFQEAVLRPLFEAIGGPMKDLGDYIKSQGPQLKEALTGLVGILIGGFKMFVWIIEHWKPILYTALAVVGAIVGALAIAVGALAIAFGPEIAAFGAAVAGAVESLGAFIGLFGGAGATTATATVLGGAGAGGALAVGAGGALLDSLSVGDNSNKKESNTQTKTENTQYDQLLKIVQEHSDISWQMHQNQQEQTQILKTISDSHEKGARLLGDIKQNTN